MNVRSSNNVICYPAPPEVDSNHGNPCSLAGNSLFPKSGNTPGGAPKSDQITEAASPGSPDFGVFPFIFPANQGSAPRDEFATDCAHRQAGPASVGDRAAPTLRQPQSLGARGAQLTLSDEMSRVENALSRTAIAGSRSITNLVNSVRSGRKQR